MVARSRQLELNRQIQIRAEKTSITSILLEKTVAASSWRLAERLSIHDDKLQVRRSISPITFTIGVANRDRTTTSFHVL
jgi:hypothetical protein